MQLGTVNNLNIGSAHWGRTPVMAVLSHKIKQILLETFIEVLADELNKLEQKDNDKIKDIGKIGNNLPESRRFTSKTNQKSSKHVDEEISDQII